MVEVSLPLASKAFRFAPCISGEPAASFWKVWSEGNEVYATSRAPGGASKISVHESGQIHIRVETKAKQDLAQLMPLSSGHWHHAFELRFLLSQGANLPFRELETLKKKQAHLIPVPSGFQLHANLVIGATGLSAGSPLPSEFAPAGQALWATTLRDGRPAVLVGRMLEIDDQDRKLVEHIRFDLRPTVTLSKRPAGRVYIETHYLRRSEGGNVLLVVPMGEEGVRSESETSMAPGASYSNSEARTLSYHCNTATANISAPNGSPVALVELEQCDIAMPLPLGRVSQRTVGKVRLTLNPDNLIPGSRFSLGPTRLACRPEIDGSGPKAWEYSIFSRFDGHTFTVEIRQVSCSIRGGGPSQVVGQLDGSEEVVMSIPTSGLSLSATIRDPANCTDLIGRFLLRVSK